MIDRHSLQFRLAWRLAAVLALACTAVVVGFGYFARNLGGRYADQSLDCIIYHFLLDVGWTLPIIVVLATLIGILAVRQGLKPLADLSTDIAAMRAGTRPGRLLSARLPSEIAPLVQTLDHTFQRLHDGYEVQRHFTSNAAHELRTPLAVLRSDVDSLPAATAAKLQDDIDRMTRIVAQLLALARAEAGDLGAGTECDLAELTSKVAATLAPLAHARAVSLAFDRPSTGVPVQASLGALETIASNLIDNAIAHSPAGSEVRIRVEMPGRLIIDDQGPGIPNECRERIFERFWRGEWSSAGGSGLGLSIVKEITQRIGANVAVGESRSGGARFLVSLPAVSPTAVYVPTALLQGA
jgi:signal transduction histidine kinase